MSVFDENFFNGNVDLLRDAYGEEEADRLIEEALNDIGGIPSSEAFYNGRPSAKQAASRVEALVSQAGESGLLQDTTNPYSYELGLAKDPNALSQDTSSLTTSSPSVRNPVGSLQDISSEEQFRYRQQLISDNYDVSDRMKIYNQLPQRTANYDALNGNLKQYISDEKLEEYLVSTGVIDGSLASNSEDDSRNGATDSSSNADDSDILLEDDSKMDASNNDDTLLLEDDSKNDETDSYSDDADRDTLLEDDLNSNSNFTFSLSNLTGATWAADYNGNNIFYDEAKTEEAVNYINKMLENFSSHLDEVEDADKFFDEIEGVYPYNKEIPDPRFKAMQAGILEKVDAAYNTCMSKITDVTDAIKNYSDGSEIIPKSTATLNQWLYSGSGGSGAGDGGGGSGIPSVGDEVNKELENSQIADSVNDTSNISNLGEDDDLVIPEDNSVLSGSAHGAILGGGVGATLGAAETEDLELSSEQDSDLSNLGASLLGGGSGSKFFVPSLNSTVGSADGVKSSGVVGAVGAVAAAAVAVGGKVYYDKKQDAENAGDDDENELKKQEVNEETSNVDSGDPNDTSLEEIKTGNSEINFDLDGVKFKESLFNDSEVDD